MKKILLLSLLLLSLGAKGQVSSSKSDAFGDWLRFAPLATTYVLKGSGVESASSWRRLVVNSTISVALTYGTTWALKHTIHDMRPDHSDHYGFPSGHTSIAFAGATVLCKEFRHRSPWIAVAGFGVATFVGVRRVSLDRHDWDDVLAGAAIGFLGTEAAYWLGDKLTGEHSRYHVGVAPDGLSLFVDL